MGPRAAPSLRGRKDLAHATSGCGCVCVHVNILQIYYEDKPVVTRFTKRGIGNHHLVKTIYACAFAGHMHDSHEVC